MCFFEVFMYPFFYEEYTVVMWMLCLFSGMK